MSRSATIAIFGLIVISAFFWLPVLLMICAELLCGGIFGMVASGVVFFVAISVLAYSSKRLMRAVRNKVNDPAIEGTPESMALKNARYIQSARVEGMEDDAIAQALLGVGWSQAEVDAAFVRVDQGDLYPHMQDSDGETRQS